MPVVGACRLCGTSSARRAVVVSGAATLALDGARTVLVAISCCVGSGSGCYSNT